MSKLHYANVFASGGFAGESFDIAAGPANTGLIDVLLSAGDGALTDEAPHVLASTGALGAPRALDISGMETESAGGAQALRGRFFYLTVQNSDIDSTNTLTLSSSATINGAASFVIDTTGDYLFHHIASGVWRANYLPDGYPSSAELQRIPFATTDWVSDAITVIASGSPGAGQVGPHDFAPYNSYIVQVLNTDLTPDEMVDVETQFAGSGNVTIRKAARQAAFNGIVVIVGTNT